MLSNFIYLAAAAIFSIGLLMVVSRRHYLHKIIGLSLLQSAVLIFYLAIGKVAGASPPVIKGANVYTDPIPHVLMLTAIVVGFAVLAVGISLANQINISFGTLDSEKLHKACDQ